MDDLRSFIASVKAHLHDNDGELVYWGEPLSMPVSTDEMKTQVSSAQLSRTDDAAVGTKAERLQKLFTEVIGDCQKCPLAQTRKKIVFGVGNPESGVMFVGEGPGFDEDRQGEPFVGKAGQLLDKILAAIQLDRTSAYIANIVKCHPMVDPSDPEKRGNDRPPEPSEIEECLPYLKEQIRILSPKVIVALGAVAARTLLSTTEGITRLRGKVRTVRFFEEGPEIPVLPTYHPAALLRNPDLKKDVWTDMKLLREMLQ
jgi:DNA polymerase